MSLPFTVIKALQEGAMGCIPSHLPYSVKVVTLLGRNDPPLHALSDLIHIVVQGGSDCHTPYY